MFTKGDIIAACIDGGKIVGTFSHFIPCKDKEQKIQFFCCIFIANDENIQPLIYTNITGYPEINEDITPEYHLATEEEKKLYREILNEKRRTESKSTKTNEDIAKEKVTPKERGVDKPNNTTDLRFDTSKQNVWFTSDLHFSHENIMRFCKRPFISVDEMNETLIKNWNDRVKENDVIFILGDFCFGGSKQWNGILDRLNGKKYLIIGNHDEHNLKQGYLKKIEKVSYMEHIFVDNQSIYLSHFPLLCFAGCYREKNPVWALFGHVHSKPSLKDGRDSKRLSNIFPTQYDVGVDNNDYKPISFSEVKEIITQQRNSLKWKIKGKIMNFIMKIMYQYF